MTISFGASLFSLLLVECYVSTVELGEELLSARYPIETLASLTKFGEVPQVQHVSDGEHAAEVLDYGVSIWLATVAWLALQRLHLLPEVRADFAREAAATKTATIVFVHHDRLLLGGSRIRLLAPKVRLLHLLIVRNSKNVTGVGDIRL